MAYIKSSPKTKVLFRLRSMETGGVQKVMTDFMRNLSEDQFDVSLLLNLNQGEMLPLIPENVKSYFLAEGKEQFSEIPLVQKIQLAIRRVHLKAYELFPSMLQSKLGFVPDVEIAFTSTEYDALLRSPFNDSKKIAWFHADIRDATLTDEGNLEVIKKLQQFDKVVFVSQQTQNIIKEKYNEVIPNGQVIYNPFDQEEIRKKAKEFTVDFQSDVPVFLSIGRFINRKGYHTLVEAHAQVIEAGFPHKIIVLGQGPNESDLMKQVQELGVEDTFLFYGIKANPYPYIQAADYFILPSKTEAYPLVIGESLVLEKPIISTKAGGVPEMMKNEVNGLLVDFEAEDLAHAIQRFLTEPELIEKINENNKTAYQHFDNEKIFNQMIDLLSSK